MKGDFTRSTFDREKHYSGVRWQQGRVHLDADWNEAMEILAHLDRTTRRDVIGPHGGPAGEDADGEPLAGFLVYINDDEEMRVSGGRYYVDGILVENEEDILITEQPDLPTPAETTLEALLVPSGAPLETGYYLAFLDVWERHVTPLEDPSIREKALGGPDTATRTQVVWQVKLMPISGPPIRYDEEPPSCEVEPAAWDELTVGSTGMMTARAEPESGDTGPCVVPARAGYRGLENQLYRVEVHEALSETEILVKWSRENGSVVSAWLSQDAARPNRLTVQSIGRDDKLGFAADDWVELTDDTRELRGLPGLLVRIQTIEGNVLVIDPGSATVDFNDFPLNPKVRRWDMPGEVGALTVDPTVADNWIDLENGIQVSFEQGIFRTGDYWMVPARTATREIEWPVDDSDEPMALFPHGIEHHYSRLAVLRFDGELWEEIGDCRHLFPPLTAMIRLFHVAGDGQETMPGQFLPQPIQVGVSNGRLPVFGAWVSFTIIAGAGLLESLDGEAGDHIVVETDEDGIAECRWQLDATTESQRVEVLLLEIDGKPLTDDEGGPVVTPLFFNANLSIADQVSYDSGNCGYMSSEVVTPAPVATVQEALDHLCPPITLTKLAGDGQIACVGTETEHELRVGVLWGGRPLRGLGVGFEVVRGAASVEPSEAEIDGSGVAVCRVVEMSPEGGPIIEVQARLLDPPVEIPPPPVSFILRFARAGCVYVEREICPDLDLDDEERTVANVLGRLCEGASSAEPGVRVEEWLRRDADGNMVPYRIDEIVPVREFADGMVLVCDRPIHPSAVDGKAVGALSVEIPFPLTSGEMSIWGQTWFGYEPVVIAGYFSVTTDMRGRENHAIFWRPTERAYDWLTGFLFPIPRGVEESIELDKLLVRFRLNGNFIWSSDGEQIRHLDAALFAPGKVDDEGAFIPRYPSGDQRRGGVLEARFYITEGRSVAGRFGLLPVRDSELFAPSDVYSRNRLGLAMSVGVNRDNLIRSNTIPPNYRIDRNVRFQREFATELIQSLEAEERLPKRSMDVLVRAENPNQGFHIVLRQIGQSFNNTVDFDINQINVDGDLREEVFRRLSSGEQFDAVFGPKDELERLRWDERFGRAVGEMLVVF